MVFTSCRKDGSAESTLLHWTVDPKAWKIYHNIAFQLPILPSILLNRNEGREVCCVCFDRSYQRLLLRL